MNEISKENIAEILKAQRLLFETDKTKDINFRLQQLKRLKDAIREFESEIGEALWKDLHKSGEESYLTETGIVLNEIDYHIKNLKKWTKIKKVSTPMFLFPSKSRILYEPLGVSLIIAPWNYPFQLLMNPLVGAISAGCCCILKTSPSVRYINEVMERLIKKTFPENYISILHGHRETNENLLDARFDMIFFTGSPKVGKAVMQSAAKNLTPVVLELGGKSPCIVDKNANITIAAQRIIWGKTINAGQTCIAPDYLFVHKDVKEQLFKQMKKVIREFFGDNPQTSLYYPRIVSDSAFERLQNLMNDGTIIIGGESDESERYIAPTVIDNIKPDYPIMQQEIFGPILPVMTFEQLGDVTNYINEHEKPLAFYYFGKSKTAMDVLYKTTSGGACINDTLMHVSNHHLPFGGVGNSGMWRYHGIHSFMAFSNCRSLVSTPVFLDFPLKYPPFKYFKSITKKML